MMTTKEEMFKSVEMRALKDDVLYDICCVIDNEFRGKRKTFRSILVRGEFITCTTNVCDWASIIRIYKDKIVYIGPHTLEDEGYQEILDITYCRIAEIVLPYFKSSDEK